MKKVYFLSGLGADSRAFSLLDLSFCQPVFINWIKPFPAESLPLYAARLLEQIVEPDATVVGLSFGGMLASEMARQRSTLKVIIIASNKNAKEFPFYLLVGRYLPLYRWAPDRLYRTGAGITRRLFGARSPEGRKVFSAIQQDADPKFVKWAISAILQWKANTTSPNIIHIHGSRDKLLPSRYVKAQYLIPGGTHILPLDYPKEISNLLKELIA